jgi:hypothetical protein
VLAYNLGNLWRRLVLPARIDTWSLTSLQQRLVKTGGRLVKHARYYPQSPKRISLWEIHPVYAIDVCKQKSLGSCRVGVAADWTPLHEFIQNEE